MSEIPSVEVLKAIKPVNSGTGEEELVYDELVNAVDTYKLTNPERSVAVWESQEESLEESSAARQLAFEYLLRTAIEVNDPSRGNYDLWADRFTQATVELYGEPDSKEALRLISDEYSHFSQLIGKEGVSQQHVNFLLDTYKPMISSLPEEDASEAELEYEKKAIHKYGEALIEEYQPLFDLIDNSGKSEFNATDLQELFEAALDWLEHNDDIAWQEWAVVQTKGTTFSVNSLHRQIKIAAQREVASIEDTRGLMAHELLVHALRGKNGYKRGDQDLATGLAGYLDAEEGLGILVEEAVNGILPVKAYDRYIDIALALGSIDGVQRTRKEVFHISFARQLVRAQAKGVLNEVELQSLERKVWGHVDRIYRGGRGDNLGTKQAIFTKDIAYYSGYKKMAQYISSQLASGKNAREVLEYLSQGKFDPNNQQHVEQLNKYFVG
jgi:hypothetical protein